ncbi:MAG: RagB/SusD family nutrient uptake outer membrane protein, partial [Pedobacter sp.]
ILACFAGLTFASCNKFLDEKPLTEFPGAEFYKTPGQFNTAVNGAYVGIEIPYVSVFLGLPLSEYWSLESLTGFSVNTFGTGPDEASYVRLDDIDPRNSYLYTAYRGIYSPIKACNLTIAKINETTVLDETTKKNYLGQLKFLRAWYYFHGVQVFGEIPLVTEPITGITDPEIQFPKATIDKVYAQIVKDLTEAEADSGLPWTDESGHANMAAIKALLARVYITMAGFPLQKGQSHYQLAYEKAKEVIDGASQHNIGLFTAYAELRTPANNNKREHIFQVQRNTSTFPNELPAGMVPLLEGDKLSENLVFEAALLPTEPFYNSYAANDKRKQDKQFFQTFTDDDNLVKHFNYKFWDDAFHATANSRSGLNIWLIRYADVLLTCAEAKARADGGSTGDPTAVNAYTAVHGRATGTATVPGGLLTSELVMKERFFEQAFEYLNWFDMIRTHETMELDLPTVNPVDGTKSRIVPLIGFKAKSHLRPFKQSDLLQPLPTQARLLNPKLNDPAQ